jgi:hypothetical protein
MLIGMVVIFGVCWTPSVLFNLIRDFQMVPDFLDKQNYLVGVLTHCISIRFLSPKMVLKTIVNSIDFSSTLWNPILYALFNEHFRTAFAELFRQVLASFLVCSSSSSDSSSHRGGRNNRGGCHQQGRSNCKQRGWRKCLGKKPRSHGHGHGPKDGDTVALATSICGGPPTNMTTTTTAVNTTTTTTTLLASPSSPPRVKNIGGGGGQNGHLVIFQEATAADTTRTILPNAAASPEPEKQQQHCNNNNRSGNHRKWQPQNQQHQDGSSTLRSLRRLSVISSRSGGSLSSFSSLEDELNHVKQRMIPPPSPQTLAQEGDELL